MDLKYGVYAVLAPMLFLAMWKHSLGTCSAAGMEIEPEHYITAQVETILHGLAKRPTPARQGENGGSLPSE
jgi:TetR/AcrR family transcriptional regulator